jgi:aerobic-type carbon monoxide dehydrogenase small subunit (CoxS/CutS family)
MVVHEIETTVNGAVRRAEVEPRLTLADFLRDPSDDEIREALSGNLRRCTGYQGILKAVRQASASPVEPQRRPMP